MPCVVYFTGKARRVNAASTPTHPHSLDGCASSRVERTHRHQNQALTKVYRRAHTQVCARVEKSTRTKLGGGDAPRRETQPAASHPRTHAFRRACAKRGRGQSGGGKKRRAPAGQRSKQPDRAGAARARVAHGGLQKRIERERERASAQEVARVSRRGDAAWEPDNAARLTKMRREREEERSRKGSRKREREATKRVEITRVRLESPRGKKSMRLRQHLAGTCAHEVRAAWPWVGAGQSCSTVERGSAVDWPPPPVCGAAEQLPLCV